MTDKATSPYDPHLAGLLLSSERDALIPLLRSRPDPDFDRSTCCPGWTVRHVLAHCSAALSRVVGNRFEEGVFSPEANDRDIADRADWPHQRVVDELERGMTDAGPVMAAAGGKLDGIALGEWIHAGDVREAWGEPGAYGGASLPHALRLLTDLTRARGTVPLAAELAGFDDPLRLGAAEGERAPARFTGEAETLMRLVAGRPVIGARYALTGVGEGELNLFG